MTEVVTRHRASLLRYAVHLLGSDSEAADDVAQECFTRLWRAADVREETHVRRWLYLVCRNLCLDRQRAAGRAEAARRDPAIAPLPTPDATKRVEARETLEAFLTALAQLPEAQQEVLRLRLQGGLRYREIAEVTGLSASNVGYLLHQAMKQLRAEVLESERGIDGRRRRVS